MVCLVQWTTPAAGCCCVAQRSDRCYSPKTLFQWSGPREFSASHYHRYYASRGQRGGAIKEALRAGARLSAPSSLDSFANLLTRDEGLARRPELEELHAGLRRAAHETLSVDDLGEDQGLKSDALGRARAVEAEGAIRESVDA